MLFAALDTNVLAYAEGAGDITRQQQALQLVERLPEMAVVLPAQVLGELYRVLTGKLRQQPATARDALLRWSDAYHVRDSSWTALQSALDLAAAHGLAIWDSVILSVAAENRCRLLLSEDLQHGFTWRGTTVINPFAEPAHELITVVVDSHRR